MIWLTTTTCSHHPRNMRTALPGKRRTIRSMRPNRFLPAMQRPTIPRSPEWRGDTPVLCIPGRGPLDEAASAMLAQSLEKHGIRSRTVPYEAVSRARIASLELVGHRHGVPFVSRHHW